jgi:hypothetical protein
MFEDYVCITGIIVLKGNPELMCFIIYFILFSLNARR